MEPWTQYILGGAGVMGFVKFTMDVIFGLVGSKKNGKAEWAEHIAGSRPRCIDDPYIKQLIDKMVENSFTQTQVLKDNNSILKQIRDNGRYKTGG